MSSLEFILIVMVEKEQRR